VILYLIASGPFDEDEFLGRIEKSLRGGVDWVQIRVKDPFKTDALVKEALKLKRYFNFKLIVNDFPEIAVKYGADGAHIGKEDGNPARAREMLRGKIMGVSCYNDLERGRMAQMVGADYAAFGALFPTTTKENTVELKLETVKAAKEELSIPVCVIGGIKRDNIDRVLLLNPDIVAISSAIFLGDDPEREARFFKSKMG